MDTLKRLLGLLALFAASAAPVLAQTTPGATYRSPAFAPRSQGEIEQQRTVERLMEQQRAELVRGSTSPVMSLDAARLPPAAETPLNPGAEIVAAEMPPLPAARPGECFALVRIPAQVRERQQVYQRSPAREWVETRPRRYALGSESQVQREAYEQTELLPAGRGASEQTLSEPVLVQPARQVWRRGSGPVQRIDQATGEIYCLVEEPAVYRRQTRQVANAASGLRRVVVPEELGQRPTARLLDAGAVERLRVPAQLESRWQQELLVPERYEWRPVLCPTNMTPEVIGRVQQSLRDQGYQPGPVDGRLGPQTERALDLYQRDLQRDQRAGRASP
jgi:hypothetical protein